MTDTPPAIKQVPPGGMPDIGYRGYKLARSALYVGVLLLIIGATGLFTQKLTGDQFISVLPWVGLLGGVGTVGQYAGNVAEKWGGTQSLN